nr:hypothetical protein Itr_chr01CG09510 [Ipomoea trifida]
MEETNWSSTASDGELLLHQRRLRRWRPVRLLHVSSMEETNWSWTEETNRWRRRSKKTSSPPMETSSSPPSSQTGGRTGVRPWRRRNPVHLLRCSPSKKTWSPI